MRRKAIEEIDNLTDALVNSEQLRKELEALLDEFQQMGTKNEDIASDPKVLELQKELALLQEVYELLKHLRILKWKCLKMSSWYQRKRLLI